MQASHQCNLHRLVTETRAANLKSIEVPLDYTLSSKKSLAHTLHELETDKDAIQSRPWNLLPRYFSQVLILTLALVKMAVHAKLGGLIEVMGMMTGKIIRNLFIVMDVYSLPVEGTETRVNAQSEAYEYMVQYLDLLKSVGIEDSIVGWYHSHPGYGCWLSGIDVATQSLNQNFQDPYLAIVVDPIQTANQGKVEIGAFRTFPVGHVPSDALKTAGRTDEPGAARKRRDLGAHSNQYYALDIKLFKSPRDEALVDQILNKSWVSNLAIPLTGLDDYTHRLSQKLGDFSANMDTYAGHRETRGNSRFNALFESMVRGRSASCQPSGLGLANDRLGNQHTIIHEDEEDEDEEDDEDDDYEDDDGMRKDDEDDDDEDDEGDKDKKDEMDHRSVSNLEALDSESSVSRSTSQMVLMRKDLGPIQLDYREPPINKLNLSSIGDRKRRDRDDHRTVGSTEFQLERESLYMEFKQRSRLLNQVSHSELLGLLAERAKKDVFGSL
ncbi:hypothetical protein PUMCH_005195 [Australozyma saopauloensis]|uniref:COP9 signalosome complex subunit 5 n=1 Tax=Australozyma saopauloensis TaxID=291208 RepID=A0AAX4HGN5_9ASCO|nr:hypothetical protein PUMCH_005195 [[Candida] saopauloensis]